MPKFSEVDWLNSDSEEAMLLHTLQQLKIFPYSGADGDLFRKNGLPGWRISTYKGYVRIQKKEEVWRGIQYWDTVKTYGNPDNDTHIPISQEEYERFKGDLLNLIDNGVIGECSRYTLDELREEYPDEDCKLTYYGDELICPVHGGNSWWKSNPIQETKDFYYCSYCYTWLEK